MVESFWNKVGRSVKRGVKIMKDISTLPLKAFIYPIKKPSASMGEMQHDAKISLKEAAGINVSKEEKEYISPIETTEASKDLGVQVTKQGRGLVIFLVSRTLTGNIFHLTEEQLNEIEELDGKYSSVCIDKGSNRIMITVNVEGIINDIRNDYKYRERSQEEVRQLVIDKIYGEADRNLKGVARIANGEFVTHTDRKLLYGIGKALYREGNRWLSEAISPTGKLMGQSSEVIASIDFNITNPNNFPYGKKSIFSMKSQQSIEKQARELGIKSGLSNLEDVSPGKVIKPSFVFNKEKEGKSRS
ncbi:hypothetical protein [Wolbachia endosymbiont of Dirofilaria (Dirofilaria) immitis]|uniref:hypothetical protein n=1 Tax=Wolbachia endosymbiont of Dirofilaria (Dirofilaria) immitis TaxID=1812115 RepID=UPI00158A092C|nr:hypothetical protein [Wolbachia endosymbiont of Dirofilaria (Dirofilaria) immitis]QKX02410.1 hypothetical protein GOY12_02460 [Wolbachia endosymbiont of Dirofilaria (Dirofilaria) immitis]